jgi:protocatechuate 3,4-dioxygenase beta subunit
MSSSRSRPLPEDRRGFLRYSSLGLAALVVGCRGAGGGAPTTKTSASPSPLASNASSASNKVADPTPECHDHDTEDNIEGPFFKPSSPERANLVEPGTKGVRLTLRGRVFGAGCGVVLAGAILDFWQADASGAYREVKMRGHQIVGADGSYVLQTVIPGHYLNGDQFRPAHIHVKVKAQDRPLLTTQLYFEGDPYNDIDPFIKKSLIMPLGAEASGAKSARFDFVLKAV